MKSKYIPLLTAFLFSVSVFAAPPAVDGKAVFTTRCAGCHNVNKQVVGPPLAGVDRRHSLDWIINFVHSSQTVIKKGYKEAVALFAKFNNIAVPDHKDLSDGQIKNLVEYIRDEAKMQASRKSL